MIQGKPGIHPLHNVTCFIRSFNILLIIILSNYDCIVYGHLLTSLFSNYVTYSHFHAIIFLCDMKFFLFSNTQA